MEVCDCVLIFYLLVIECQSLGNGVDRAGTGCARATCWHLMWDTVDEE